MKTEEQVALIRERIDEAYIQLEAVAALVRVMAAAYEDKALMPTDADTGKALFALQEHIETICRLLTV